MTKHAPATPLPYNTELVEALQMGRVNAIMGARNSLDNVVKATHAEYAEKFAALLRELGEE